MTLGIGSSSDYASTSTLLAQLLRTTNSQETASDAGTISEFLDSDQDSGLQSLFAAIDSDGDGTISASEFTTFSNQFSAEASATLLSAQADSSDSSAKFANLDSNGDGSLDLSEFEAGMPPPPPPTGGEGMGASASNLFASLDTDGDGAVSAEELSSALSSLASDDETGASEADALFSSLDSDGDGSISESELSAALSAMAPPPPPAESQSSASASGAQASGGGGSSDESEETSYDPLDTNEDGYVSFAERMAGMASGGLSNGTMATLLQSISMAA